MNSSASRGTEPEPTELETLIRTLNELAHDCDVEDRLDLSNIASALRQAAVMLQDMDEELSYL